MISDETRAPLGEEEARGVVLSGLALRHGASGRCLPIIYEETVLREENASIPGSEICIALTLRAGVLHAAGKTPGGLTVNGVPANSEAQLAPGDLVTAGGSQWEVVAVRVPALLRCYSAPHVGLCWPLGCQPSDTIGRRGKRRNDIELEDRTVSRVQATISAAADGLTLLAESLTYVNGVPLESGHSVPLQNGDMLRFGEVICRYHLQEEKDDSSLRILCLGGFQAFRSGAPVEISRWQSHGVRFLLVYLAYHWPARVEVARVTQDFWPDLEPQKQRANLRVALSRMRKALEYGPERPFLLRKGAGLGIEPEFPFRSDIGDLRIALQRRDFRLAVDLYRGPFLEDCYLDWAIRIRSDLETQITEAAQILARESPQPAERLFYARKALEWNPCDEGAAQQAMAAARELGRPEEALRIYERLRHSLSDELDAAPGPEVERQHGLVRSLLA